MRRWLCPPSRVRWKPSSAWVSGVKGTPSSILTGGPLIAPICGQAALRSLCHTGTATYFAEFPEDIRLFGVSFNTAGPAGIARAAILRWRRLLAGIGMFLVMIVCWTLALRAIDLSVAQPLSSMGLLVTLGLSRVTLRETLGPRRWVGGLLITAGVIAVGLSQ